LFKNFVNFAGFHLAVNVIVDYDHWSQGTRPYTSHRFQAVFIILRGHSTGKTKLPLERILAADEVVALSTLKEVMPVTRVGDVGYGIGRRTTQLASAFRAVVRRELALD